MYKMQNSLRNIVKKLPKENCSFYLFQLTFSHKRIDKLLLL